jgi:hydrogenase nickel incorporation protein HypA/HybF
MHESGMIRDLVRRAEDAARDAGAKRIAGLSVWLGALSQMSPAHFRDHFDSDARGTLVEGAHLTLEASDDVRHPQAQSVMLQSLELEV